jgi:hypothetical protein
MSALLLVQLRIVDERVHRRLPAGEKQRVVAGNHHLRQAFGVFEQRRMFGAAQESPTDWF